MLGMEVEDSLSCVACLVSESVIFTIICRKLVFEMGQWLSIHPRSAAQV